MLKLYNIQLNLSLLAKSFHVLRSRFLFRSIPKIIKISFDALIREEKTIFINLIKLLIGQKRPILQKKKHMIRFDRFSFFFLEPEFTHTTTEIIAIWVIIDDTKKIDSEQKLNWMLIRRNTHSMQTCTYTTFNEVYSRDATSAFINRKEANRRYTETDEKTQQPANDLFSATEKHEKKQRFRSNVTYFHVFSRRCTVHHPTTTKQQYNTWNEKKDDWLMLYDAESECLSYKIIININFSTSSCSLFLTARECDFYSNCSSIMLNTTELMLFSLV